VSALYKFTSLVKKINYVLLFSIVIFLTIVMWTLGLLNFVKKIPDSVSDHETVTDAVVVLTGGSERLKQGLKLLTNRKAKKLFISGVYRGNDVRHLLQVQKHNPAEVLCCINLGYEATSTAGNAIESKNWINENHFKSFRLVTANYHMPRSLMLFHHIMPKTKIIPHPVFPALFKRAKWWAWPRTATLIVSEYSKYKIARTKWTLKQIWESSNIWIGVK